MKTHNILFILMSFLLLSCASTNTATEAEITRLRALIEKKSFEIENEWAEPQVTNAMAQISNAGMLPTGSSVGSINLIGNSNYFRMKGDSVMASLPYYGERQFGGNYGSRDAGIEFEGVPKKISINKAKQQSYKINFSINDKNNTSERYDVIVQIYPSLSSTIQVISSQKNSIRYRGRVLKKEFQKN